MTRVAALVLAFSASALAQSVAVRLSGHKVAQPLGPVSR